MTDPYGLGTLLAWYREENLETLKAIAALSLYRDARLYLDEQRYREFNFPAAPGDTDAIILRKLKIAAEVPLNQAYINHYCPEENGIPCKACSRKSGRPCAQGSKRAPG